MSEGVSEREAEISYTATVSFEFGMSLSAQGTCHSVCERAMCVCLSIYVYSGTCACMYMSVCM